MQLVKDLKVATLADVETCENLKDDPYTGLTDMWHDTPQRDDWGRVDCYAWAVDRLMEGA